MVLVECDCPIVLGVDDDRIGSNVGTKRPADRVHEHRGAEAFALVAFSDGQASDPYRWHEGIARQLLGDDLRDVRQWDAARRDGVVADDGAAGLLHGDEAGCNAPTDVRRDLGGKVAVERREAGAEPGAVVRRR